jgi:integrase
MALTDKTVANAKPAPKRYKLFDAEGLYVLVQPDGAKYWRFKYRFAGKEKLLAFGVYDAVSLKQAKEKRSKAKAALADGRDPSAERQTDKRNLKLAADNSFEAVATAWHTDNKHTWSEEYAEWIIRQLKADAFPWLGKRPIVEITAPDLLQVIRRIEQRNALVVAHRCRANCEAIFAYGIATGAAQRNPAAEIRRALKPMPEKQHHASVKDPKSVGKLLRAIDGYEGSFITKSALRLAPLVFVRPGELRNGEWSEFDLDAAEWRIPGERMKMGQQHIVPLSRQAVAILRELRPLTGDGNYVFPGVRSRAVPMSENTINAALRRLDYGSDEMTGHGFRSMASTLLNEAGWNRDAIERQLAHTEKNKVRAAYNAAEYLPERRKMMQMWADYLDGLSTGANVTPIKKATA